MGAKRRPSKRSGSVKFSPGRAQASPAATSRENRLVPRRTSILRIGNHTPPSEPRSLNATLLVPLRKSFGEKPLLRIRAEDISAYQKVRRETGISGRTLNMEIQVLRQMMKRGKVWSIVTEDVRLDRENTSQIAKVLSPDQKHLLFEEAGSKSEWMVAHCAAVLAASTTCRSIELKHLRWDDVNLFEQEMTIKRSKTDAGRRTIPLNSDAISALARLWERAQNLGSDQPFHFVFPACERLRIDPTRPQKTWRTAWRSLVKSAARRSGREAAKAALESGNRLSGAKSAYRKAVAPLRGFRFHDLRHQCITELAERGTSDAVLMSLAGHLSREMMEHYSHVRMAAKREALATLETGLMKTTKPAEQMDTTEGFGRPN
jgi:integrase